LARARANHPDVTELLESAATQVREGAWSSAATALIAAWRVAPSAQIARALVLVDKNLPVPATLDDKTVTARELHWHGLARSLDEAVLPTLLAENWPVHPRQAKARVELLEAWPRSPRTSTALLALLGRGQYRSRAGRVVTRRIFTMLIDAGDPAVTEYLARLDVERGTAAEGERASMPAIMRRRRPAEPVWEPREADALAAIEGMLAPTHETHVRVRDELIRAVYESPLDDAPRLVLADHLIERGDPRGELIALQIQRHRDGRRGGVAHERALIRRGGRAWFDGLDADGATEIVIDRGFPISATSPGEHFRAPAWATIESLMVLRRDRAFGGAPVLRGLRRLHGIRARDLPGLHLERDLDALWMIDAPGEPIDVETRAAPARLGLFDTQYGTWRSRVRELATNIHGWPIGRRLTTLQLEVASTLDLPLAFDVLAAAPRLDDVVLAPYASHAQWTARVQRHGLVLEWHGGGIRPFEAIVELVRGLGVPEVETVELTGTRGVDPAMLELVRGQLARIIGGWPNVRELRLFGVDPLVRSA